jgi:hypothetical protein
VCAHIFDTDFFCRLHAKYFYFPWNSNEKKGIMLSIRWRFLFLSPIFLIIRLLFRYYIRLPYHYHRLVVDGQPACVPVIQAVSGRQNGVLAMTGLMIKRPNPTSVVRVIYCCLTVDNFYVIYKYKT